MAVIFMPLKLLSSITCIQLYIVIVSSYLWWFSIFQFYFIWFFFPLTFLFSLINVNLVTKRLNHVLELWLVSYNNLYDTLTNHILYNKIYLTSYTCSSNDRIESSSKGLVLRFESSPVVKPALKYSTILQRRLILIKGCGTC